MLLYLYRTNNPNYRNIIMQLQINPTAADLVLVFTKKTSDYWHEKSENTDLQDKLYGELVPSEGESDTVHGMLLRAATRIYYDIYNNGGGNMVDNIHGDWLDEDDDDYEEPEYELVGLYKQFFENLKQFMPQEHQDCVAKAKALVIEDAGSHDIIFDHLIDRVLHTILTTTNVKHDGVES